MQWELIKTITEKAENPRIIAVGDDDQNVYEFRGASPEFMSALRSQFNAKDHRLLKNFRSAKSIVEFSNKIAHTISNRIKMNEEMEVVSAKDGELQVVEYEEGHHLSGLVQAITKSVPSGTTALLTRTNNEALMATTLLKAQGVSARYVGGSGDFSLNKLREIRLFSSMMKKRHPQIGTIPNKIWVEVREAYLDKLKTNPLLNDCRDILNRFEEIYKSRFDMEEWRSFTKEIKVADVIDPDDATIFVSTMHKSKGKEFDNVFIFLDNYELKKDEDMRLLYVACTRAKSTLSIHVNNSVLHSCRTGLMQYHINSTNYPAPTSLEYLLNLKEIYLGSQEDKIEVMKRIGTGEFLQPDITPFPSNDAPGLAFDDAQNVTIYSKKFQNGKLHRFEQEGFSITKGQVQYIVTWYDRKKEKEFEVAIPKITLTKD
jgi:ATP-dependent DNA helicase RecQ